jgi:hypothetical protein
MDAENLVVNDPFHKIAQSPPEEELAHEGPQRWHRLLLRGRAPQQHDAE